MTESEIWDFVCSNTVGILTTLRRDGNPISLPTWYVVDQRQIYVETWGKKLNRIRRDRRSSFLVEAGSAWSELKAVHFVGSSELVAPDDECLSRVQPALQEKYKRLRTPRNQLPDEVRSVYENSPRAVVRFTPVEKPLNWDNGRIKLVTSSARSE